jgi:hypothetical protein
MELDYELYDELTSQIRHVIEEKNNPKEVIKTLAALIDHVVEHHLDEK